MHVDAHAVALGRAPRVERGRIQVTGDDDECGGCPHCVGLVPGVEARGDVGPDDQEQLTICGREGAQRVDRVGGAGPLDLERAHLEAVETVDRGPRHRQAVRRGRDDARALLPRIAGNDQQHAVQAEGVPRAQRGNEMRDVHGIERSAQHADALAAPGFLRNAGHRRSVRGGHVPAVSWPHGRRTLDDMIAPYAASVSDGAAPDRSRRDAFTRFLVRVWLPDRPGALGAVASRIGSLGADIVGIDVLEQGEHVAIDEFAITLLRADLIDLLAREIEEVDGVSVEAWRRVERFPDPRLDFLRLVEDLLAAPDLGSLETRLVSAIVSEFTADWSAIVGAGQVLVAAGEPVPAPEVLEALATGMGASPLVASGVTGPDDLAVAPMPARHATLLAGREGHPFRTLERRQLLSLARIADRLPH